MATHQIANEGLNIVPGNVQVLRFVKGFKKPRALVRLLLGKEFGVNRDSVLEIVDAEIDSFTKTD